MKAITLAILTIGLLSASQAFAASEGAWSLKKERGSTNIYFNPEGSPAMYRICHKENALLREGSVFVETSPSGPSHTGVTLPVGSCVDAVGKIITIKPGRGTAKGSYHRL